MIVAGLVKVLLVGSMHFGVIFAGCDLEVRDPSELTINVSLLTT